VTASGLISAVDFHHAYPDPVKASARFTMCRGDPAFTGGRSDSQSYVWVPMCIMGTVQRRFSQRSFGVYDFHPSENNYPALKPPSNVDLNMADRADDDEYLEALLPAVQTALDDFGPELLFYVEARTHLRGSTGRAVAD